MSEWPVAIHPSIDLLGGKAVQLQRGDRTKRVVEVDDPVALAERFARYGEVAVIDLDAAFGTGDNLEVIEQILARVPARVGGGIRSHERADHLLRLGARRLIIGTRATPDFLAHYPAERLIAAIDSRGGEVVTEGWQRGVGEGPIDRARALAPWVGGFLYTLVDGEGMMGGIDLDAVRALRAAVDRPIVAAGGIHTVEEICALAEIDVSTQLGMALYTGKLDLADVFISLLRFGPPQRAEGPPLVAVVTCDQDGEVLMQAWADDAAVRETLTTGQAHYHSRSRGALWRKGATSGHTQRVRTVRFDCDRDALRYVVEQEGRACHLPQDGCFGEARFRLEALERILHARRASADEGSYSRRLLTEPGLVEAKLREEVGELIEAQTERDIVWESADVVFFVLARLAREGIPWHRVLAELEGRQGRRRGAVAPTQGAGAEETP